MSLIQTLQRRGMGYTQARLFTEETMNVENLRAEAESVQDEAGGELTTRAALFLGAADEIEKLKKILAFIPGRIVIEAQEKAGYGTAIKPTASEF